jgi:hypothetical protein
MTSGGHVLSGANVRMRTEIIRPPCDVGSHERGMMLGVPFPLA